MSKFVALRVLQLIPLLLVSSILVFLLIHLAPGDPALLLLGEDAQWEDIVATRAEWGLDQPLPIQYKVWLTKILHGNLGKSYKNKYPVMALVRNALPATIELAFVAFLLSIVVGFSTGIWAALRPRSRIDLFITVFQTGILATPQFWLGLILVLVFALQMGWLPPSGRPASLVEDPRTAWRYLLLPALSLGLSQGAALSRFIRSSLLDTLMQDYIRTARSKGLGERFVITRHALRNAMIPVATMMGINVARLLSGAVVLETIFAWPGLGRLMIESVDSRDYAVVQGTLLLAVVIVLFVNLLVDIAYAVVDPRIRL